MTEVPRVSQRGGAGLARVVLRYVKSWGGLLGPDGHAREVVPVDLWASVG
jgi:hypothetical protein